MLLAHVAGTSGRGDNLGYSGREPPEPLVEVLEGGLGDTPPVTFQALPNVMWHYSGGGYYLLQLLVADLTGASFEDAADEFVLGPLEMSSTTFEAPLPRRFPAVAADGHIDGRLVIAGTQRDPAVVVQACGPPDRELPRCAAVPTTGESGTVRERKTSSGSVRLRAVVPEVWIYRKEPLGREGNVRDIWCSPSTHRSNSTRHSPGSQSPRRKGA